MNELRTGGGAVMPHALITRMSVVRAEADPLATNLVRFCAVRTFVGGHRLLELLGGGGR